MVLSLLAKWFSTKTLIGFATFVDAKDSSLGLPNNLRINEYKIARMDVVFLKMKMIVFVPTTLLIMILLSGVVSGQQKATMGYAPVNGLKMYYEIHGSGEPVVLLHGAFMAISNNFHWAEWIDELSKTRKVIAIEMQGHGRTADTGRDFTYDNLAD